MNLPESTYEFLLWKYLGGSVNESWVNWAYQMMKVGYENEHLIELAGEIKPYNQFELAELTDNIFRELALDYSDKPILYKNYLTLVADRIIRGDADMYSKMKQISQLYLDLEHEEYLSDITYLYWVKDNLEYDTIQYYWNGATRENIDQICLNYFKQWMSENEFISPFSKKKLLFKNILLLRSNEQP